MEIFKSLRIGGKYSKKDLSTLLGEKIFLLLEKGYIAVKTQSLIYCL